MNVAIERTIDREVREFGEMIESQLARLVEASARHLKGLSPVRRDAKLRNAIVILWRQREDINPSVKSLAVEFAECVDAAHPDPERRWADDEERLLDFIAPREPIRVQAPQVYATDDVERAITERTEIEAPQKLGKECPPCWRCRWFDGWLPLREVRPMAYDDFEVTAACKAIDQRKVEIAHFVRGTYPEELLAE